MNRASQIPPTLAGGAIARGALFTIHGVRLGSSGQTTLVVTQGKTSTPVQILDVQARKIEALMPRSAPLGSAGLAVVADGQPSRPFPIEVTAFNPGIFSRNGEGWGPGRIDNIAGSGARAANSTSNPARPGQHVTLVTTGMGDAKEATVIIGNRSAKSGPPRATDRAGEEEITVRIPLDTERGCYVPVYLMAGPGRASNVVTMSISSRPGGCDPGPVPLLSAEKIGVVALSRTRMKARRTNASDAVLDDARIAFNATSSAPTLTPVRLLPPTGTCTAYTSSFQADADLSTSMSSIIGPGGRGLDAGATLTLNGAGASRSIGEVWRNAGSYRAHLGSASIADRRGSLPLFLEPGEFVLRGTGGRDVGPFHVAFSVPAPFNWIDRDQISVVDRSRAPTVHWNGTAPGQLMLIVARNVDQLTTAIGMCLCVARSSDGQLTIPPALLANVPASRDIPGTPFDELAIGSLAAKASAIQASGLNGGFVVSVYATARIVEYR
ncbi:MAG: hypothetical protein LAP38_18045 [Acidobacteriia bacterium]|nr:hypothetical protein [Terriglobia bacterium]